MLKLFLLLSMIVGVLNAASGRDDDVLLLSGLSHYADQAHKCYISPLSIQKDGASEGPSAEWVNARYELTDGARTIVLRDEILCPWNLMKGGRIMCKPSATKWNCLKVFPEIPRGMKETLRLLENEELFFELPVLTVGEKLTISPFVTMVRRSEAAAPESEPTEIRKNIHFKYVVVSDLLPPKVIICVK